MANYRIKVERLNNEVELAEELERGVEVNGFVLLGNVNKERALSCIMHMSRKDIADAIHAERPIVEAALLSVMLSRMEEE